jgi:hypothetical protein
METQRSYRLTDTRLGTYYPCELCLGERALKRNQFLMQLGVSLRSPHVIFNCLRDVLSMHAYTPHSTVVKRSKMRALISRFKFHASSGLLFSPTSYKANSLHSLAKGTCRWPSTAQSFLASGPVWTHDHNLVRSKTIQALV